MEFINRIELAEIIYKKLKANEALLVEQFEKSNENIAYVFLDDLIN